MPGDSVLVRVKERKAVETNSRDALLASSIVLAGRIPRALLHSILTIGRSRNSYTSLLRCSPTVSVCTLLEQSRRNVRCKVRMTLTALE